MTKAVETNIKRNKVLRKRYEMKGNKKGIIEENNEEIKD